MLGPDMSQLVSSYVDGEWVIPRPGTFRNVINPATDEAIGQVALGSVADVDRAVRAARAAFESFADLPVAERIMLFERICTEYEKRAEDLAQAMCREMGSPISFSRQVQAANPLKHFREMIGILKIYEFEQPIGGAVVRREPIGVCGLITAWNWPVNLIATKLVPALAAGCTIVLKPSEFTPFSAAIVAEILQEAGLPRGVFNLVNGEGPTVGEALSRHPGVDMISLTGSRPAGTAVLTGAAPTIKRVVLELGGKSANIVLPDADLENAIPASVRRCFVNSGQSCQAPTRLLVHRDQLAAVVALACATAEAIVIGPTENPDTQMGPLANAAQFDKVQRMIGQGIEQGATLVCGGLGRPEGMDRGFYVRPTVFSDVTSHMTIAREEIFGPVLSILSYGTEEEAIRIANDTEYGLAGYVQSRDPEAARRVARKLRAGRIYINGAGSDRSSPMGGYGQSGLGREQGVFGLEEYLEVKSLIGQ